MLSMIQTRFHSTTVQDIVMSWVSQMYRCVDPVLLMLMMMTRVGGSGLVKLPHMSLLCQQCHLFRSVRQIFVFLCSISPNIVFVADCLLGKSCNEKQFFQGKQKKSSLSFCSFFCINPLLLVNTTRRLYEKDVRASCC